MKFKEYPKTYEDYYNTSLVIKGLEDDKITAIGVDNLSEYFDNLKKELITYEQEKFDRLVKIYWLLRKFRYAGQKKYFNRASGRRVDIAFSSFMRRYLNSPNDLWVANKFHSSIFSYFDDFFPAFDEGNPFNTKYSYPYTFMNHACLYLVYKLEERLDLLAIGEKKKMKYSEFMNYVINYIMSYNEEHGETYTLSKAGERCLYTHVKKIQKK